MKNLGFQFFKKIRNVLVLVRKELEPPDLVLLWFLKKTQFRVQFWISDAVSVLGNPVRNWRSTLSSRPFPLKIN